MMATSLSGADYLLTAAPEKSDSFAALLNVAVALSDDPHELYLLESLLRENELDLTGVQLEIVSNPAAALKAFLEQRAAAVFLPRHLAAQALAAGAVEMSGSGEQSLPAVQFSSPVALQEKRRRLLPFTGLIARRCDS